MIRQFFSLLLTASILSFTAAAQAPQKNGGWKRHTSAKGKFSIMTPCTLAPDTEAAVAAGDDPYHSCDADDGYFIVSYSDLGKGPVENVQEVLDATRNGLVEGLKGKLVSEKKIALGSVPGRELVMTATIENEDYQYKWRVFVVGGRGYTIGVGTPKAGAAAPGVDKFLSSFAVR
jgi:hypothetical protein